MIGRRWLLSRLPWAPVAGAAVVKAAEAVRWVRVRHLGEVAPDGRLLGPSWERVVRTTDPLVRRLPFLRGPA
jgi:hypothetical protein